MQPCSPLPGGGLFMPAPREVEEPADQSVHPAHVVGLRPLHLRHRGLIVESLNIVTPRLSEPKEATCGALSWICGLLKISRQGCEELSAKLRLGNPLQRAVNP